jgi:hypothetical protein
MTGRTISMIRMLAVALLMTPLASCLAGAAIGVAGATAGAAVQVTGAVVGATVKTAGTAVGAVTAHHNRDKDSEHHD